MLGRRSEFDVTNTINVTDVDEVCREVCRLYVALYPDAPTDALQQAFTDMGKLFRGEYPGYLACEAPYHDLQHTLDVTLAMARLLYGYEHSQRNGGQIGQLGVLLGLICALFHDSGYIRRSSGERHKHGAELTTKHVSRGGVFLEEYLPTLGLGHAAHICTKLLHFTGYEMPVREISLDDPRLRLIGKMIGTADLLAQMADRCYLEKCRDRLYPEFVASGMASPDRPGGGYASGEELLRKTPGFFRHVMDERLDGDFDGVYRYMEHFFSGGRNLYMEAIHNNQQFLGTVMAQEDMSLLRRSPAWTLNPDIPPLDIDKYNK
ncbi:MAG TPA: hypothetical protein VNI58_07445 [Mariprofundaceae bacterium]|nr:hypothetical protein [Mariprofundaceae bacterium]